LSLGGGGKDVGKTEETKLGSGICGTPGGGRKVKPPGLNSGAAILRGLLLIDETRVWEAGESEAAMMGEDEANDVPKTNGFAKGLRSRLFKEDCW
jgi:hypothetical protein